MKVWVKSMAVGLAAAALIFLASNLVLNKGNKNKLFTAHYTIEIEPDEKTGPEIRADLMHSVILNMQQKLNMAGYAGTVLSNNEKLLEMTVRDIEDMDLVTKLIEGNSKVEFREVYTLVEIQSALAQFNEIAKKYLSPVEKDIPKAHLVDTTTRYSQYPLAKLDHSEYQDESSVKHITSLLNFAVPFEESSGRQMFPSYIAMLSPGDSNLVSKILRDSSFIQLLPHNLRFRYGAYGTNLTNKESKLIYLYAIRGGDRPAKLQNEDILQASNDYDHTGNPQLSLQFNKLGSKKWAKMTADNVGRSIAVIVNNEVISAPTVLSAIEGGNSVLNGEFTEQETRVMAAQLSVEQVPATVLILNRDVAPQKRSLTPNLFLLLGVFIIGAGATYFIFNMLKNK